MIVGANCPKCGAGLFRIFMPAARCGVGWHCGSEHSDAAGFEQSDDCRRLEKLWTTDTGLDSQE